MQDQKPKLIILAGPTASGKSALAVDLAMDFQGEIINADSMQVYRSLDIGTAKLSISERRGVAHHMIDVVNPDEEFNASIFRKLTTLVIRKIIEDKKTCFVVGGTGLYIKTLLNGLMECPASDPDLRKKLIQECDEKGSPLLHERLKMLDPESADRIHPNDKSRVIRALEIISATDKPLSSLIMQHGFNETPFTTLKICLNIDREKLYNKIDMRTDRMVKDGLVNETEALLAKGYSPDLRPMQSLGYRHAIAYLNKDWTLEEMIFNLKRDTRRYAKRQLTWFRSDDEMIWVEPENTGFIRAKIQEFID